MTIDVYSLFNRQRNNHWDRVSVGDIFENVSYSYPDKVAIKADETAYVNEAYKALTYTEIDMLGNQFANGLLKQGVKKGDTVYMLSHNSVEAVIAKLGIAKSGATAVPVNVMSAEDVIVYTYQLVEPAFIIADAQYYDKLQSALDKLNDSIDVIIPIGGEVSDEVLTFDEFIANQDTVSPEVTISGDDIWEILFTSGTTSWPKGAMLSHNSSVLAGYNYASMASRNLRFKDDIIVGEFFPIIYHISDQSAPMAAWLMGGTFIMSRDFSIPKIAEAVTKEKITFLVSANARFTTKLIDYYDENPGKFDFTSLTAVTYSSGLGVEYHKRFKEITNDHLYVWMHLGQTECIAGFAFDIDKHLDAYQAHGGYRDYAGRPTTALEVKLIDDEGKEIREADVPGEAVYRSPIIFSGYYKNPEATEEALQGGWFHSGDLLAFDKYGLYYFVDRKKDIVKSGGENVSSERVQTIMRSHPAIDDVAIIGLPHEKWHEAVTAFVSLEEGQMVSEEELIEFSRQRLGGFETPKRVIFLEEFPRSSSNKIQKYALREEYKNLYEGESE